MVEDDRTEDDTSSVSSKSESDTDDDVLNLMSTYEFNHDNTSVSSDNGIMSKKLPVYDAVLNKAEAAKTIIDGGASTLYVNEKIADRMGIQITKIKPRKVKVADKDIVMVNGICTFNMKLADLPSETITAYTFPLGSVDLILGLPWLDKHNPRVDWRTLSYEFIRNGRRYHLWPAKPTPNIRIATPEEFKTFVDKSTTLHLMDFRKVNDETVSEPPDKGKETPSKIPRRLLRWIKRKYPKLLREIGEPANLEPFKIDTGDTEPINIRPRPHSPIDLEKIKEFIEENIKME